MKQLFASIALLCCLVSQTTQAAAQDPNKKDREERLSLELSNQRTPAPERDQQALDYAKKFSTDLPQWLPYLAAMEDLTQTSLYLITQKIFPPAVYQETYNAGWIVFSKPIFYAMRHGNFSVAKALIDYGAAGEKNWQELLIQLLESVGETPQFLEAPSELDKAVQEKQEKERQGRLQILLLLLEKGAKPNPPDNGPLMTALFYGNSRAAEILLNRGAPANKIVLTQEPTGAKQARFPLLAAIEGAWRNPDRTATLGIINLLIGSGANVNSDPSCLEAAINLGAQDIARLLVQKGVDLRKPINLSTRATSFDHIPVIHAAAYSLMSELVSDLIKKNISATTKTAAGMTPLHLACYPKELAVDATINLSAQERITRLTTITQLLLKNGVDINTQDSSGNTAFYYLISWTDPAPAIEAFMSFTPDPAIKNRAGKTAIDRARELQKAELDFNTKNNLAEHMMEKAGNRDWPSDGQIRAAYEAGWDAIIARMQKLS